MKKAPVELSIATEGSGEHNANLFKSESDKGSLFLYIILTLRLKVEKYVKKTPMELSIATEGSGEPYANLF